MKALSSAIAGTLPCSCFSFQASICCVQVMVNAEKERMSLLFTKALLSTGSMDAVSQQMASYPQYLESFLRAQHYILHMDGPLPLPYRHYIAIMVREGSRLVLPIDASLLTSFSLTSGCGAISL